MVIKPQGVLFRNPVSVMARAPWGPSSILIWIGTQTVTKRTMNKDVILNADSFVYSLFIFSIVTMHPCQAVVNIFRMQIYITIDINKEVGVYKHLSSHGWME